MSGDASVQLVRVDVPWRGVTGAVLVGFEGEVLRLAGAMAMLWLELDRQRDTESLVRELTANNEAEVVIRTALADLRGRGLVVQP